MPDRRGFTLAELMIAMVMMLLVSGTMFRMLTTMQRVSRSQAEQVDLQSNVRSGTLVVINELKEIGYDTNTFVNTSTSDILAMTPTTIQFRAMRGFGLTCGAPDNTEVRILKPFFGLREPQITDGFLLFLENDKNQAGDDMWLPIQVNSIDYASDCGGQPAIRLSIGTPKFGPGPTDVVQIPTSVTVGGPVRIYEDLEFGLYAGGGRSWLGAKNLSLAEPNYIPVVGPLDAANGFSLEYRDSKNLPTAVPNNVRAIEVFFNGETDNRMGLAGQNLASIGKLRLNTRVALRNTLRP